MIVIQFLVNPHFYEKWISNGCLASVVGVATYYVRNPLSYLINYQTIIYDIYITYMSDSVYLWMLYAIISVVSLIFAAKI